MSTANALPPGGSPRSTESSTSGPTGSLAQGKLGTTDLVAQSLAVGPITSAALLGGIIAAKGGSAGPLYLVVVLLGILGLGAILVMFARRYTHAGVMYEYVGRTLGPTAGISTAGFYYLAYIILGGPTMLVGAGVLGHDLLLSYLDVDIPFWLISLGVLLFVALVNIRGVDLSVRAQLTIFVLSVVPYLVIAVTVIAKGGRDGNSAVVLDPSAASAGQFLPTFMFCALLFVGVESAASLGEEARDARKSVPRAIIATILIVAGFCLLMQYAGTIGFGADSVAVDWASDPLGLSTLGSMYVGTWIAPFAQLGLVLDMIAVAIGFMVASSRGIFALARGGLLPGSAAKLSRWQTPVVGIAVFAAVSVVGIAVVALVSSRTGMDPYVGFSIGATLGGLLVMSAYFVLIVSATKLLVRREWHAAGWIAVVVAVLTVGAGIVGSVIPLPADEARYGVFSAGVLLALCAAWGIFHGIGRNHTLPELADAEAPLPHTDVPHSHII
ncbi:MULTISPECIES: APC family permease [unclassified Rhodococcus (in: high G+C Gram-positive bacteria)]|uniref:APC family permease n=1 Tax=unclassified Rhodococcus (in: high G+C Gram-positive bacteria) TaxID=192944 RepID=UPI00096A8F47|nr:MULTISPECIES: APC family permease [unclassified Rhodococcus (in: high G+C Gram-positive bacteria)]